MHVPNFEEATKTKLREYFLHKMHPAQFMLLTAHNQVLFTHIQVNEQHQNKGSLRVHPVNGYFTQQAPLY